MQQVEYNDEKSCEIFEGDNLTEQMNDRLIQLEEERCKSENYQNVKPPKLISRSFHSSKKSARKAQRKARRINRK